MRDNMRDAAAPLSSIDLFSGVGGITHGLSGICKPVLYCDICPASRRVLLANMASARLPRAPVMEDVRLVTAAALPQHVGNIDFLLAGFPCQGFSSMGLRGGLEDDRSGLFSEVVRVAKEFRVRALFLENVPGVLSALPEIHASLAGLGYALAWTVLPASYPGAPHERARWFCLAYKSGFRFQCDNLAYRAFPWSREEPARTAPSDNRAWANKRMGMLGNAVVPDAVRLAFFLLASGFTASDYCAKQLRFSLPEAFNAARRQGAVVTGARNARSPPSTGMCSRDGDASMVYAFPDGRAESILAALKALRPQLSVRLNPRSSPFYRDAVARGQANLLRQPRMIARWATPRAGNVIPSRVLTHRTVGDLPTQLRYASGTTNRMLPLNPVFIEHIMGYPEGWTRG